MYNVHCAHQASNKGCDKDLNKSEPINVMKTIQTVDCQLAALFAHCALRDRPGCRNRGTDYSRVQRMPPGQTVHTGPTGRHRTNTRHNVLCVCTQVEMVHLSESWSRCPPGLLGVECPVPAAALTRIMEPGLQWGPAARLEYCCTAAQYTTLHCTGC